MYIALGILEKDGKVLVCRRNRLLPGFRLWEFPTTEVGHGETIEDALERWTFESTGLRCVCSGFLPALDGPGCRIFPVRMACENLFDAVKNADFCKLLKYNELRDFRFSFPSVIFIKWNKKIRFSHFG